MPDFNLAWDRWIPVRDARGQRREVSIAEAILQAHEFRRIEDSSPLAEAALHRVLLAVLHRALMGPRHEDHVLQLFVDGRFPERPVRAYLEQYAHRFNLFDPVAPFYQVPDLPDHSPVPWTKLLPELASGHNPTLFDHATDDRVLPATPAAAARALVTHQTFVPGGLIKRLGVTAGKGAPIATTAVFVPMGTNLFETLVLNLPPYVPAGDAPLWERPPYRSADLENHKTQEPLVGWTRVYTWLSRAVRLLPEADGTVRYMGYGPGVVPMEDRPYLDPMCAYRTLENGERRPVRLSLERGFWRDFEALLPEERGSSRSPVRVLDNARFLRWTLGEVSFVVPLAVFGQVTDQAKVLAVQREIYPFPLAALNADAAAAVRAALELADSTGIQLHNAGWTLAKALLAPGKRQPLAADVRRLVESFPLMSQYWSRLERDFVSFLHELGKSGAQSALSNWIGRTRTAVHDAWNHTISAVGLGARQLRAMQLARQQVLAALESLKRQEVAA